MPDVGTVPLCVLFNPRAQLARTAGVAGVREALANRGLSFEVVETASPEEARARAREAAHAGQLVVAGGGDGTAHVVGDALLRSGISDPVMGVLPLGTGNDFARALGAAGQGLREAAEALAERRERRIDVGRVNGDEYFVNGLGIGFDAEVVHNKLIQWPPLPGYLPTIVRTILSYRPRTYRVLWSDGSFEGEALMLAVMNGESEGGGFRLAPDARLDDGRFDVVRIDPIRLLDFVRYVRAVRRGTHTELPIVHLWRTDRLTVECDAPLSYHLDGEYRELAAGTPLEIELHPQHLRVIA